ncbi:MAG TPA: hypothetical protein VHO70_04205, partial [Chitinispirillaceae bacterium]|nr:hypothetical protein [Chitinispirillaceae bacterium]
MIQQLFTHRSLVRSVPLIFLAGCISLLFSDDIVLKGTVFDINGKPASGVKICVWPSDMAIKSPETASHIVTDAENCSKTDRKGTYSLTIRNSKKVSIIGARDNFRFIHHITSPQMTISLSDTLTPCGSLVFFVRKELAQTHNDVTVSLKGTPYYSLADINGQISLPSVPAGNYSAFVISGKPGYHDIACSLHIKAGVIDTFSDTLWLSKSTIAQTNNKSDRMLLQTGTPPAVKDSVIKEHKKPVLQDIKQITVTPVEKPVEKSREKPKVYAGKDTTVSIKDQFKLRGTATIKDGHIVLMEWAIGKKPFVATGDGILPLNAPVTPTVLQCVFRATADNDSLATDTITIRVISSPPVLKVRGDSIAGLFDTIHLYGKATDNGSIVSTAWDIGNTGQFTPVGDTVCRIPPSDNPPLNITCI